MQMSISERTTSFLVCISGLWDGDISNIFISLKGTTVAI